MFDGAFRNLLKNVDEFFGNGGGVDGFLDHLRQPVLDSNSRAQILYQQGPMLADIGQRQANFRDGLVSLAATRFLSKASKSRAQQALYLAVSLVGKFFADFRD